MEIKTTSNNTYEAYHEGKLIGVYPDPSCNYQLYFKDWYDDMISISINGFTKLELKAKELRIKDLKKGINKPLDEYKQKDVRPRKRFV